LAVLEQYWYNAELRKGLSKDKLAEIDFLRTFEITFDKKQ